MSHNQNDVPLKQSMIENSQKTILLCDHTKFGSYAFMHVAPLEKFDIVITGRELDEKICFRLAREGDRGRTCLIGKARTLFCAAPRTFCFLSSTG